MKHIVKSTFPIGAFLIALGICAASASARTVSPFAASKPYNSADSACFSEWYGAIINNCSGNARAIQIAIPVDTSGGVWGYATAYGATAANNVGCQTFGIDQYITSVWASPVVYLSTFGSPSSIGMGGAYVPDLGPAFMACWLNQGGQLRTVSWGQ